MSTERPISLLALEDIREEVALGVQDRTAAKNVLKLMLRDLLAAHDWQERRADEAEAWTARLANDRECEQALMQIGVARAVAKITDLAEDYKREGNLQFTNLLRDCGRLIVDRCAPAELPPHLQTLAENRRMREALAEILSLTGLGDGGISRAHRVAHKALTEKSP